MRRTLVSVVVVLLCVVCIEQAGAGGIGEFLFGSKPRMVQWFAPSCDGDLTARDPQTLREMTFDLEGNGNRVVFDPGIPVERGLILIGTICPKTGPNESFRGVSRLDGNGKTLEIVEGPRADSDQERWLTHMVARARDVRGTPQFRGFQTAKPPYFFAIDTGLLSYGAHSVEVFIWVGKRTGASVVLPFRVTPLVDEDTGESQPTEYEDTRLGTLSGVTGPPAPDLSRATNVARGTGRRARDVGGAQRRVERTLPRQPSCEAPPPAAMNFPPRETQDDCTETRADARGAVLSDETERSAFERYQTSWAGRTFDLSGYAMYQSIRRDRPQHVLVVIHDGAGRFVSGQLSGQVDGCGGWVQIPQWKSGVFCTVWSKDYVASTLQLRLNGRDVATIRLRGPESAAFIPILLDNDGGYSVGGQPCPLEIR